MRSRTVCLALALVTGLAAPGLAQTSDWPLHNLDPHNTRFASLAQIDTSNVRSLELKWSYQTPPRELVRATTPLVIDGIMYFNSGSKLTALDAATGETIWTYEGDPAFAGGGRGPAYGDGRIYAFGPELMYAVDARSGELVESFGDDGLLAVARAALTFKYPDTYPPTVDTTALGFQMTNPPTFAGDMLLVGLPFSEGLVPDEQVWPTQPVPYTARGVPQEPFCATHPRITDPALAPRVRQAFHPYQVGEFIITSPHNSGGANYGPPSFSLRTGLLYVTGKNDAYSPRVKPVSDTLEPGPGYPGQFGNIEELADTSVVPSLTVAAYDPGSGTLVWHADMPGVTNAGNLVTAGNVVFQGIGAPAATPIERFTGAGGGTFYGFDAASGERLFTYETERSINASPLTYQVNGVQYVAVAATNAILVFGLP